MNTTNDDGKKGTEVPRGMHSVVPGLNNLDCACEDPREVTDLVLENAVTLALSFSIHVQQVLEWKENLDREIVGDMTEVATYYRAVARVALSGDVAEERLAATVAWLAERYVVIINLPELPGPMPVGAALAAVDVGVVMLMDGWTVIDDAKAVADALDAAVAGPVGYALMEN